jgi:hypothetical protein
VDRELEQLWKEVMANSEFMATSELQSITAMFRSAAVVKPKATQKIEADHATWRHAVFPKYFYKPDGWFHTAFWDKVWAVQRDVAPPPLLLPWFRDGGKSVSIRTAGLNLAARGLRRYVLYFSGTQEQSDKHVQNMSRMLRSSGVALYYPDMGTAQLNDVTGARVSWNRKRIVTMQGLIIDSLGLDSASRGINYEELRPDIIFIDDIDKSTDSLLEVLKKIGLLAGSIFPTGQHNTWVVFAQNVIHDNSVMARTLDDRAEILLDCEVIGPVPALKTYSYDRVPTTRKNRLKFKILKGVPSWPEGFGVAACEKALNDSGFEYFEREYQHNTKIATAGMIYPGCKETHHIVTWSELADGFARAGYNIRNEEGEPFIPVHWLKGCGLDYGTTPEHPSVLKWVTVPGEFEPFSDIWIWYRERCRPRYPHSKMDVVEPVSPITLAKIMREDEYPWHEDRNMVTRVMSHEQSAAKNTFNEHEKLFAEKAYDFDPMEVDFSQFGGLDFIKRKGDARSGIAQMQDRFLLDMKKPHPFRLYPDGYQIPGEDGEPVDVGGQPLKGRPFQIFVVDDDQGALYIGENGKLEVQSARDDDGMIRSRAERTVYKNKASHDGREQNTPVTLFNDAMDAERYLAEQFAVESAPATDDERASRNVDQRHPHLSEEAIAQLQTPIERQAREAARQRALEHEYEHLGDVSPGSWNPLLDRLEKMRHA